MAGIFDEVMDGINAKEPKAGTTPTTTPAAAPAEKDQTSTTSPDKALHSYSDAFNKKYGKK